MSAALLVIEAHRHLGSEQDLHDADLVEQAGIPAWQDDVAMADRVAEGLQKRGQQGIGRGAQTEPGAGDAEASGVAGGGFEPLDILVAEAAWIAQGAELAEDLTAYHRFDAGADEGGDGAADARQHLLVRGADGPFAVERFQVRHQPEQKAGIGPSAGRGGRIQPRGHFPHVGHPAADDLRSNMVRGGAAQATELSPREREICDTLGPALRERGLLFVGIDVIDGNLTEINVTSPTGLQEIARFDGVNLAAPIWDAIEAKYAATRTR